jgi:hypothetical protein
MNLASCPAVSFGISRRRGGQGDQLPRRLTRYASFGSQTYLVDFSTLRIVQLYAALVPAERR